MLTLMFLTPLSSKAQDDTASAPVNAPVADFNDQSAGADELSSVVEEIRSLRQLLSEIRGDVVVLRKMLEKRADVSRSAKKPLPNVIPQDVNAKVRIPARQSVLLDQGKLIARIAVADPGTVDVVQFTPEQIGLVGMKPGTTTVTVWFDDSRDPLIMLATVFEEPVEPVSIDVSNSPAQSQVHKSIEQALDAQAEVEAIDQPLIDVSRQLRDVSGQNFAIDLPALEEEGVTTSTSVSLQLRGVTLRSALKVLLSDLNLTWVVENEVIKITSVTRAMGTLDVRAYRVGGLLMPDEDKEQQLERLIELVQSTIEPDSWNDLGGPGTIRSFPGGDSIFVRQHQSIHHRIELLLTSMGRLMGQSPSASTQSQADGAKTDRQSVISHVTAEHVFTVKQRPSGGWTGSELSLATIDPSDGRVLRVENPSDGRVLRVENGREVPEVATRVPRVQVAEGLYVELPTANTPPRSGVPMVMRLYKPSPGLVRVFSKEGTSRIDDLHGLLKHIRAAINPDSWKLPDAKTDVVFGNQIAIYHTPGTHDRISRLLKRMEAEAHIEDFRLQPAETEKR
jgi:hypothetical protein